MTPPLTQTIRSRWLALVVHGAFWLLAFFTLSQFGGRIPEYRESVGGDSLPDLPIPVHKLSGAFSKLPMNLSTNTGASPFFSTFFVPAPAPTSAPPPTTRKVQLVYQGYFESAGGLKHAVIKVATNFTFAPIGSRVETNLFVADAGIRSLVLTNLNSQTNTLLLNTATTLEVPLQ